MFKDTIFTFFVESKSSNAVFASYSWAHNSLGLNKILYIFPTLIFLHFFAYETHPHP